MMLVPASTLSSPDLKVETNSSSFAVNSRRHLIARSGHFSQGTFRPEGGGTAETVVAAAAAAIQPSCNTSGCRPMQRVGTVKSSPRSSERSTAADKADNTGEIARPLARFDEFRVDFRRIRAERR